MNTQRYADRAMQIAPFSALKGFYKAVRIQERINEPRKKLGEDGAEAISNTLNKLRVGTTVKIRYYDVDAYTNIKGVVTEINPPIPQTQGRQECYPF